MATHSKKRAPNMDAIAQSLGVSIATVSRALNDQPGVGTDTRQRILEMSEQLNYAPHSAARPGDHPDAYNCHSDRRPIIASLQ